jgi:hypothetical protein
MLSARRGEKAGSGLKKIKGFVNHMREEKRSLTREMVQSLLPEVRAAEKSGMSVKEIKRKFFYPVWVSEARVDKTEFT